MKRFTNGWGGGLCLSLFFVFFILSDSQAQTRYVDTNTGVSTGECPITAPCSLSRALDSDNLAFGDASQENIVAVRVRRENDTVTISEDITVADTVVFAAYQRGGTAGEWVKATLDFTGTVTIAGATDIDDQGQFRRDEDLTVRFKDVVSGSWNEDFTTDEPNNDPFGSTTYDEKQGAYSITGTLTTRNVHYEELIVTSDLTIVAPKNANGTALTAAPIVVVDSLLEVKKGVTLTIGSKDQRIDLRVPLKRRQENTQTAKKGSELIVAGKIDGNGRLWIAHRRTDADRRGSIGQNDGIVGTATSATFYHQPQEYHPTDKNVVDHEDCIMITDGNDKETLGEIAVGLYGIATGNLCIDLPKVSDVVIGGSITGGSFPSGGPSDVAIISDVFFRNDVIIDGDVHQWGDSRIVFEKKATINGKVLLANENVPTDFTVQATFGTLSTGDLGDNPLLGISGNTYRRQINETQPGRVHGGGNINTGVDDCNLDRTSIQRGLQFSGVQFHGPATIEDDLELRFNRPTALNALAHGRDPQLSGGTICETQVMFLADSANTKENFYTSTVGGDLIIEDGGWVFLDGGNVQTDDTKDAIYVAHNLSVDGDIYADGDATVVQTNHAAKSLIDGMCSDKGAMLDKGARLTLTSGQDHDILTHADGLTIPALVILDGAEVEGTGNLISTTLHIGGSGGELKTNGQVQVGSSAEDGSGHLILQGDGLSGSLTDGSVLSHLTYASSATDAVSANDLEVLEVHLGSRRLRLEDKGTNVET
ncbi:MAG: hypothetical protein OXF06_12780, partial [Bacteroidetes bacterium]|nr:hypothetical protein [Bacteroidota bacterium]